MQFVGKVISTVSEFYKDINPATLTGAIDIIVVEDENGELQCSPFHVRFGKLQYVLRPQEKAVVIHVNGKDVGIQMKLGDAGEAFFVVETKHPPPRNLATSPIVPPDSDMADKLAQKMEQEETTFENLPPSVLLEEEGNDDKLIENVGDSLDSFKTADDMQSNQKLNSDMPSVETNQVISQPQPILASPLNRGRSLKADEHNRSSSTSRMLDKDEWFGQENEEIMKIYGVSPPNPSWSWEWGEIPTRANDEEIQKRKEFSPNVEAKIDIKEDTEQEQQKAHQPAPFKDVIISQQYLDNVLEKLTVPTFSLRSVRVSKCSSVEVDKSSTKKLNEIFEANIIQTPLNLIETDESNLIFCIMDVYLIPKLAIPCIISFVTYGSLPPMETLKLLVQQCLKEKKSSGLDTFKSWWYRSRRNTVSNDVARPTPPVVASPVPEKKPPIETRNYAKGLRLNSQQLKSLGLLPGINNITFTVASGGRPTCGAHIFLWRKDSKVVISDIDGTITKSDVMGHLLTIVGRDWTHQGVAKLFSSVVKNGYKILYLTSRAIGQADYTRMYLKGVEQELFKLPDGPVIMSPDRLFTAFHREVIRRRPEEFKIACLKDIQNLFGDSNPFYAGFGNRVTDFLSYQSVEISPSRIFTINPQGEVKLEALGAFKSTYSKLNDLVDHVFPPLSHLKDTEFNDFNYWGTPVQLDLIEDTSNEEQETSNDDNTNHNEDEYSYL